MKIFDKNDYLPATILCKTPFIIGCFFEDIMRRIEGFKIWYDKNESKYDSINALLKFGYHYETPERMEVAKECIASLREKFPRVKFHFLCNSELEKNNFSDIGESAIFCNQNAFLDERRYMAFRNNKKFNAIYLARLTPIKRHQLALEIPKLLLIGDYRPSETYYAEPILKNRRPDSVWIRKVQGIFMFLYMNKAKIGLCLSPEEGAMYSCAEYGLCGLGVLTTKCLGGREYSLSPKYFAFVEKDEPSASDVAEAAEALIAKNFDPKEVRKATIEVLNEHRARYASLIKDIFEKTGEGNPSDMKYALNFPHKWGLRCRVHLFFRAMRALKL